MIDAHETQGLASASPNSLIDPGYFHREFVQSQAAP